MLTNALGDLIHSVASFLIGVLLARFYMQSARVSFANPFGQFVMALTNWAVLPLRRILPAWRQYDLASLLLAYVVALLMHMLLLLIVPWSFDLLNPRSLAVLAAIPVVELIKVSLYLLLAAVIVQAILSWVAPFHPFMPMLNQLTRPFLLPLRRIIHPIGGVDITPLILLLVVQLVLYYFLGEMERQLLMQIKVLGLS